MIIVGCSNNQYDDDDNGFFIITIIFEWDKLEYLDPIWFDEYH